jgi:hypothetical protein
MSCKAVDSQSKEQSSNDVSDDDASQGGQVYFHTALAHCGEKARGGVENFQIRELSLPSRMALRSLMPRPKLQ